MPPLDDALAWLGEQTEPMLRSIESLVAINSFTDHREGGQKTGEALLELFALPELSAETVAPAGGRFADHRVFRTAGLGPPVGLVGHLDTVFPPGTFEGFRRDGDLARGPGVLDMKGGLVVVAFALRALSREGLLGSLPLRVVVVSDEEVGSPEGRKVIERELSGGRAALVFEAGRAMDLIITRRKGSGGLKAVARGKAAHAGNLHHEGVNALWALARFIDRAQQLTDYERGRTVNVGKVTGGIGKNTVPDLAEAHVDIRFTSGDDGKALVDELREAALQAASSVPGASVELEGGILRLPLERSAASERLLRAYAACARGEGLGDGEAPLLGGGSDANTTSALGVASIDGLGPRGKGFHTHDEQIEIASLVPKARALARFLAESPAFDRPPGGG